MLYIIPENLFRCAEDFLICKVQMRCMIRFLVGVSSRANYLLLTLYMNYPHVLKMLSNILKCWQIIFRLSVEMLQHCRLNISIIFIKYFNTLETTTTYYMASFFTKDHRMLSNSSVCTFAAT